MCSIQTSRSIEIKKKKEKKKLKTNGANEMGAKSKRNEIERKTMRPACSLSLILSHSVSVGRLCAAIVCCYYSFDFFLSLWIQRWMNTHTSHHINNIIINELTFGENTEMNALTYAAAIWMRRNSIWKHKLNGCVQLGNLVEFRWNKEHQKQRKIISFFLLVFALCTFISILLFYLIGLSRWQ